MTKACLIAALAALMGASARAADPLVDRWDSVAVTVALTALGATDVKAASLAGAPGLLARTPDGLNMGAYAVACAPASTASEPLCRGLEAIVSFAPDAGVDRGLLVDRLNHDYAAGKFTVERDGSVRLTRYVDLDGGVSPANLIAELRVFLDVATRAKQSVWSAPGR